MHNSVGLLFMPTCWLLIGPIRRNISEPGIEVQKNMYFRQFRPFWLQHNRCHLSISKRPVLLWCFQIHWLQIATMSSTKTMLTRLWPCMWCRLKKITQHAYRATHIQAFTLETIRTLNDLFVSCLWKHGTWCSAATQYNTGTKKAIQSLVATSPWWCQQRLVKVSKGNHSSFCKWCTYLVSLYKKKVWLYSWCFKATVVAGKCDRNSDHSKLVDTLTKKYKKITFSKVVGRKWPSLNWH